MNAKFAFLSLSVFSFAVAQQPFCHCPCGDSTAPCQVEEQLLRVDQVQFGAPVRTASWLCDISGCRGVTAPLAVIGGQPVSTPSSEYDFRIYQLTSADKLSYVTDGFHGGYVLASAWCCIDGVPYVAVAGVANLAGNEVEIYRLDPVGQTLTLVAYYSHGANVHSIAWLCDCGTTGSSYLAIGGEASINDKADVRVLAVPTLTTTAVALQATANKVHGATVYSVDWCTQLSCPLLAVGGKISSIEKCGINIRVFSLDCTTGVLYPYSEAAYASGVVNTVKWCCGQNPCFVNPLLAAGGSKTSGDTNIRVYYLSSRTNELVEFANTASNPQRDIYAISWNPSCRCSDITIGGGCLDGASDACNPNIFVYNIPSVGSLPRTLGLVTEQQFDTNVTALSWCKPTGVVCSYLLVGSETNATDVDLDCNDGNNNFEVALYRGVFCRQQNSTAVLPICSRN